MTLQTCAPIFFAHANGGPSGGSSMCKPGSKDPPRRERNCVLFHGTDWRVIIFGWKNGLFCQNRVDPPLGKFHLNN